MKAWLLDQLGDGVNQLHIEDVPTPAAGPGEAVLRVLFAGLNPADRYLAENQYPAKPTLPHTLGRDGIGIVEAVGSDVSGAAVGDKRIVLRSEIGVNRPGTFAQFVAVPVESLVPAVAGWSDEESAGAPLVYLTAYQALMQWNGGGELGDAMGSTRLPPSLVLITGASGGVGVACVHLAKAMGHTVVGLSRSPEKSDKLLELGADAVLDPQDSTWRKKVLKRFDGRRVDLAVDNVGGPLFSQVVESLGMDGRISCVGRLAGPVPEFNTASLFFKRARIGGVHVGSYKPAESQAVWKQVVSLMGDTRPLVDSVHPFDQLKPAFNRLKAGPMGKVLLQVA